MPTRRTPTRRNARRRINPKAIEAWKSCDHNGLHLALGFAPWEQSPLPDTVTALGVSEDSGPRSGSPWGASWQQAIEFQRGLFEIAGPPDTEALRREYSANLEDARERVAHAGADDLAKAQEVLAYREQLLEDLVG